MSPKAVYRIGRHSLLILGLFAISFNQVYMGFIEYTPILGHNLYVLSLLMMVSYLVEGYFNMYVLIPKLFLKGRNTLYFILFSLIILLFVFIHYLMEYAVYRVYGLEPGLYSYFHKQGGSFLLELTAAYFIDYIAVLGAGLTIILKYWLTNDEQVHRLEKVYIQAEVEKLKEQINSQFLFAILHEIGDIAPSDQKKASDLLMELSEILRYQLYDCHRETVLLNAEVHYITTYMQIEKLYYGKMDFEVKTEGDINRILVPPLLFIPLVQNAVKDLQKEGDFFHVEIHFKSGDDFISFYCNCKEDNLLASPDLTKIKQRLDTLYPQKHTLSIEKKEDAEYPFLQLCIKYSHEDIG